MSGETISFMYVLAQIAGIFVGFGALISASKGGSATVQEREILAGMVWIGIMLLIGAILPILVDSYGFSPAWSLRAGALIFLVMAWIGIFRFWESIKYGIKTAPAAASFYWAHEVLIQIPLVLILMGLFSPYHEPFYLTALVISAFEAAQNLVGLVFAKSASGDE